MKINSRPVVLWSGLVIFTLIVCGWFYYETRMAAQKSIEPIHLGMSYEEVESLVSVKDKTPQTYLSSTGSSLLVRFVCILGTTACTSRRAMDICVDC